MLVLTLHLTSMGGGGTAEITMHFSTQPLCVAFRRAIWSQFKDADGDLGECRWLSVMAPEAIQEP